MLCLDVIFGSPIVPDLLGIIAGHLYYFLTVLHPLAGGKTVLKTPALMYPCVWLSSVILRVFKLETKRGYFSSDDLYRNFVN